MADVKISQLTALASANVVTSSDVLPIVDASVPQTKKITVENLLSPITIDKSAGTITSLGTIAGNVVINKASNPTYLQIGSSLADDPYMVFQTDGNTFAMGIDRSDSNRFKISDNATLGTFDRFEIDATGLNIFRYTGAENSVQIHSGEGNQTTGVSQIYFTSKDQYGGNTHQSYIKSTIDGSSSTSATKMSFHNRDSGGTVQEYLTIKADGKTGFGTNDPRNTIHSTGIVEISNATHNVDTERIRFGRTDDNQRYSSIFHKLSDSAANNHIAFKLHNGSSQTEVLRIMGNNQVGINGEPSYTFQVVDSDNNGSVAFLQDNYDGTVGGTMDIILGFKKNDGNFRNAAIIRAAKDDIYTSNTQADASLQFFTTLDGTSNKRMIITSQGYFLFQKEAPGFSTVGFEVDNGGRVGIKTNGTEALYVNRSQDGNLVEFASADTAEGTISVSGSTVSYNGFSGSHESSGIPTNTPIGTVVSTIDELDVYPDTDYKTGEAHSKAGETRTDHAKIKISDSVGDKRVYGVLASFNEDNKPIVASVGIGSVKVTGACEGGDLLESNGDGTAKVQDDDIIRSKTIGKVTIGDSDTGVKLVSCVLYCG